MSSASTSQPSPQLFFATVGAYQHTAALKTAIELDIFTLIADGHTTAATIAKHCKAAERGVRILCDSLVILGFLTKQQDAYALTQDSAIFLSRKSPACVTSSVRFLLMPEMVNRFDKLTEIVRRGGALEEDSSVAPDNAIWVEFALGMAPLMRMSALAIADAVDAKAGRLMKVLDIAAGHGVFGVTIAQQNPNAKIVAVDWKAVLEVAKENAAKAGVSDRLSTIAGSAFDVDYGTDYDLALVTNFLHHFDPPTNEKFLKRVHAALKPGGKSVTLEFVPNDDRVSPPEAMFSLMMLGSTPSGDAYTFKEFESMFRNAGFSKSSLIRVPGSPESIVVSVK
jgi:SAM-dependent methyltransferase